MSNAYPIEEINDTFITSGSPPYKLIFRDEDGDLQVFDGVGGMSAYEIAVANGFVGTEAEWLTSLQGEQGIQGVQGIQGIQGPEGDPAPQYEFVPSAFTGAAIQAAFDAADAVGGSVYIPHGIYDCTKVGQSNGIFLELKPNIARIHGDGIGRTILKVPDSSGDFWSFMIAVPPGETLDHLEIKDLTIDFNTANNPALSNNLLTYPRYAIHAYGDNINIHDVEVRNYDGINGLYLVGDNGRVERTLWPNLGDSAINQGHDHSTFYITGTNWSLLDNVFVAANPRGARTAIETHGAGFIISNNHCDGGYVSFMNITGITDSLEGSRNTVVSGNQGRKLNFGMHIWSQDDLGTGAGLRNLIVSDNTFELDRDRHLLFSQEIGMPNDYSAGISLYSGADADLHIENVLIADNIVRFTPYSLNAAVDERDSAGISWVRSAGTTPTGPDLGITIRNNTIINPPGPGVRIGTNVNGLIIEDNLVIDPGGSNHVSTPDSFKCGIILTNTLHDVFVDRNIILDNRSTHKIVYGVITAVTAVTNAHARGNVVRCADNTLIRSFFSTSGLGKAFLVDTIEQGFIRPIYSVKPGSRVFDSSTGITYTNIEDVDGSLPVWRDFAADIGLILTDSGATRPSTSVPVIWVTSGNPAAAINGDIRIRAS